MSFPRTLKYNFSIASPITHFDKLIAAVLPPKCWCLWLLKGNPHLNPLLYSTGELSVLDSSSIQDKTLQMTKEKIKKIKITFSKLTLISQMMK